MPSGAKTQTVNQTQTVPQYVSDAQQNYLNTVSNFTQPFVSNAPATTVAGLSPDQMTAADLSRQQATNLAGQAPAAGPITAPLVTPFTSATTGGDIQALLDPYSNSVVNSTVNTLRRQLGQTQAGISAKNASSAAFGGSSEALQSSEANRAFSDQVAGTTAQLMAQGWDRASATAMANTAANNNMKQFNSNQYLNAANAQNTFYNSDVSRQAQQQQSLLSAIQQLFNIGTGEQTTTQNQLSEPVNMLKLLGASVPGNYGQTTSTTSPTNAPSGLQTFGGLGLSLLGLGTGGGSTLAGSLLSKAFGL